MKTINVTFRAIFEQPIGILNPMNMNVPGPFPIELFRRGAQWQARELSTPRRRVYEKFGKFASLDDAKMTVERSFERTRLRWQIWGIPPGDGGPIPLTAPTEQPLSPDEVCDLGNGQFGWYEAKDRTHIIHAPTIPAGAKVPPAACGAQVDAKCFINNRANVQPSCKVCAEVWEREYKDK